MSLDLLLPTLLIASLIALVVFNLLSRIDERQVVRDSLRQLEGYEMESQRDQELLAPLRDRALVPVIGSSLFPKADTPQFLINITTPNGSSFAETDRALRFAEDA